MKIVHADFAMVPGPSKRAWLAAAVLWGASLGVVGVAVHAWKGAAAERARWQAMATRAPVDPEQPALARPQAAYEPSAREFLAEHDAVWSRSLAVIEAAATAGVTPVAVEFAAREGVFRLETTFESHARLLEYIDGLNAGDPTLHWALQSARVPADAPAIAIVIASTVR